MFKSFFHWLLKRYHRLYTARIIWQLLVWLVLLAALFFIFLIVLPGFEIEKDWSKLFHSMTSYDLGSNPLYVFLYLLGVALFSGLLVMILTNGIRNRINKIERGDVRYGFDNHVVFLGYNEIVLGLLSSCTKDDNKRLSYVILVEKNASEIRDELVGTLGERTNIYVLHGSRTSKKDLQDICVQNAREVYMIGENERDADAINLQSLKLISSLEKGKQNRLFFIYDCQGDNLRFWDYCNKFLPKEFMDNNFLKKIDFDELAVNNILGDTDNNWPNLKLHRRNNDTITWKSDKYVHLVIFGMNEVSKKLIKAAANFCHFPNHYNKGINTLITVIDERIGDAYFITNAFNEYFHYCKYEVKRINGGNIITSFKHEQKENCKFVDIDFEFIEADLCNECIKELIKDWSCDSSQYLSIYTCLMDFTNNFDFSISLPKEVYDASIPVWMYAKNTKKMSILFDDKYPNIVPWGSCWELNTFGKWDRKITATMCKNLDIRNTEIPSYRYYQDFWDFASYLSILHTSTTSYITGKNAGKEETRALVITEYYRNCVKSLFRGDSKISNILMATEDVEKKWLQTDIMNFEELNDIRCYYELILHFGLKIFQGGAIGNNVSKKESFNFKNYKSKL